MSTFPGTAFSQEHVALSPVVHDCGMEQSRIVRGRSNRIEDHQRVIQRKLEQRRCHIPRKKQPRRIVLLGAYKNARYLMEQPEFKYRFFLKGSAQNLQALVILRQFLGIFRERIAIRHRNCKKVIHRQIVAMHAVFNEKRFVIIHKVGEKVFTDGLGNFKDMLRHLVAARCNTLQNHKANHLFRNKPILDKSDFSIWRKRHFF